MGTHNFQYGDHRTAHPLGSCANPYYSGCLPITYRDHNLQCQSFISLLRIERCDSIMNYCMLGITIDAMLPAGHRDPKRIVNSFSTAL